MKMTISLGGRHVITTEDRSHWIAEYYIWLRERNVVGEVVIRLAHSSSNIRLSVMNGIPLPVTATNMYISPTNRNAMACSSYWWHGCTEYSCQDRGRTTFDLNSNGVLTRRRGPRRNEGCRAESEHIDWLLSRKSYNAHTRQSTAAEWRPHLFVLFSLDASSFSVLIQSWMVFAPCI